MIKSPNTTQVPVPKMGESKLASNTGKISSPHSQDLTPCPYSAVCSRSCSFSSWTIHDRSASDQQYQVSSFNLPTYCDISLITPVTTRSPTMAGNSEPDTEIKLSPSTLSPSFHFLPNEDDCNGGRYDHNPPMKHKSPSGALAISTWDSSFPDSPHIPEPFYGSYGVSATTPTSRRSDSSPTVNPSPPALQSAGGFSSSSSSLNQQIRGHSDPSYSGTRARNQAPKLIAPTPSILRPATKQEANLYRQHSLPSSSTAPNSALLAQNPFPEPVGSLPTKGKKRKSPCRDTIQHMLLNDAEMSDEERVLFDLKVKENLAWKEIEKRFEEERGYHKSEAALQMQFGRAIKRLRIWSEDDVLHSIRNSKINF